MKHNAEYQPRLKNLDPDLAQRALSITYKVLSDNIEAERRGHLKHPQVTYASSFDSCRDLGLYLYALGHPLSEVRHHLAEAARYRHKVFKLRGSEKPFPVTVIITDQKGRILKGESVHAAGAVDYSLTNPVEGLQAVYLALVVGEVDLARSVATMIWDPADADYIAPDSEVCTPDQQHLAYAVKHTILADEQAALAELALINSKTAAADVRHQATMVRATVVRQKDVFLGGLSDLLAWHQKMSQRKANLNNPGFFLSLPGLGLCALAMHREVVQGEQLPVNNVYLPLDLLQGQHN